MSPLPIESYLVELLRRMEQAALRPIIAGGLGIYLKRRWVVEQIESFGRRSRSSTIPEARATDGRRWPSEGQARSPGS